MFSTLQTISEIWVARYCERADALYDTLGMKSRSPEESKNARGVKVSDKDGFLPQHDDHSHEHDHEGTNLYQQCHPLVVCAAHLLR